MGCTDNGLTTKVAKQIRIGILTGEIMYDLYIKGECECVKRAMVNASKTPKLTYEAAIRTFTKRLQETDLTIRC